MEEKTILQHNRSQFVTHLKYSFQTPEKIFYVMEYVSGGSLYSRMEVPSCSKPCLSHSLNASYAY